MYHQFSIFGGIENETFKGEKAQRSRDFQKDCKLVFIRQSKSGSNARRYTPVINLDLTKNALYGIYDNVSDVVVCVFIAANDVAAERQYIGLISAPDATIFALNPNDFDLVKFACNSFDVFRNSSSYSAGLIDKIRAERAAKFIDNVKIDNVKAGDTVG